MRKLIIKEKLNNFELNFDSITQICGKNTNLKNKIYRLLKDYFSRKIIDSDNDLRVCLDKEEIGITYFNHICIDSEIDLDRIISFSKDSILYEYLHEISNHSNIVDAIYDINEKIINLDLLVSSNLIRNIDKNLTLDNKEYKITDYFKTIKINGLEDNHSGLMSNYQKFVIFMRLIKIKLNNNPGNYLVSIFDIDKILSKDEYKCACKLIKELVNCYEVSFILYSSSEGFIVDPLDNLESINVVNDFIFPFCSYEILSDCLERNYPSNIKFDKERLNNFLIFNTVNLFRSDYIYGFTKDDVIIKLLNSFYGVACSLGEDNFIDKLELAYLMQKEVI